MTSARIFAVLMMAIALQVLLAPAAEAQSPSVHTSSMRYDSGRRLVGEIGPDPDGTTLPLVARRWTYDTKGNLTRTESGYLAAWQAPTVAPSAWTGFTLVERRDTSTTRWVDNCAKRAPMARRRPA